MRCHICDASLSKPSFNSDHQEYDPCITCLEVIADVFSDPLEEDERTDVVEATPEELLALTEEDLHED